MGGNQMGSLTTPCIASGRSYVFMLLQSNHIAVWVLEGTNIQTTALTFCKHIYQVQHELAVHMAFRTLCSAATLCFLLRHTLKHI